MDKLSSEINRLQLQVNNLSVQSYTKDESIAGLQQQLNTVLIQAKTPVPSYPRVPPYKRPEVNNYDDYEPPYNPDTRKGRVNTS